MKLIQFCDVLVFKKSLKYASQNETNGIELKKKS